MYTLRESKLAVLNVTNKLIEILSLPKSEEDKIEQSYRLSEIYC